MKDLLKLVYMERRLNGFKIAIFFQKQGRQNIDFIESYLILTENL